MSRAIPIEHAYRDTPEWWAWKRARSRCNNPNDSDYFNYGKRGIKMCPWWNRFDNFLRDMGPKPSPKHMLDRIDNDKGYCPENCRWATPSESAANRRPWIKKNSRLRTKGF